MKAISPVRSVRSCYEAVCCLSEQSLAIARGSHNKSPALEEPMNLLYDMNDCYSKLRELVPGIPQGTKVSQVEILQHVIDYIFDLEIVLEEGSKGRDPSSEATLLSLKVRIASGRGLGTLIWGKRMCLVGGDKSRVAAESPTVLVGPDAVGNGEEWQPPAAGVILSPVTSLRRRQNSPQNSAPKTREVCVTKRQLHQVSVAPSHHRHHHPQPSPPHMPAPQVESRPPSRCPASKSPGDRSPATHAPLSPIPFRTPIFHHPHPSPSLPTHR